MNLSLHSNTTLLAGIAWVAGIRMAVESFYSENYNYALGLSLSVVIN